MVREQGKNQLDEIGICKWECNLASSSIFCAFVAVDDTFVDTEWVTSTLTRPSVIHRFGDGKHMQLCNKRRAFVRIISFCYRFQSNQFICKHNKDARFGRRKSCWPPRRGGTQAKTKDSGTTKQTQIARRCRFNGTHFSGKGTTPKVSWFRNLITFVANICFYLCNPKTQISKLHTCTRGFERKHLARRQTREW